MSDSLFIENEILNRIGNKLLPDNNIEVEMLKEYKLERHDINLYDVAGKLLIQHYYGDTIEYDSSKIETFFSENTFLTIITLFIETVDIILLNRSVEIDIENIVYDKTGDDGIHFKIIHKGG